jgi:hypothetical protein
MIQSGDGDWIINPHPPGIKSQMLNKPLVHAWDVSILKGQKAY